VKGYVSAYDRNFPPWASTAETWWKHADERPWIAGGFVWTGFDYRGEPTPYQWPCINSHFGIIDMCGFPKDSFSTYKWFGPLGPGLNYFPPGNVAGQEGEPVEVWAFTNCETVELVVNGVTAGWQKVEKNGHVAWNVIYQPGAIEIVGIRDGKRMASRHETTGPAAKIVLTADRRAHTADGEDVSVVSVAIQDAQGRIVPTAMNEVTFKVNGAAKIIGVGNGDPSSHEKDRTNVRAAFNGLCMALVQATKEPGAATVEATAPGLSSASVTPSTSGQARKSLT